MLDVRKVANNMNSMEDSFNEQVKCSSFTNNLIEAYDINQCDTSITLMEKQVVSESVDKAIWVALESERMLCEKMMNDALLEKEDKNIFVRAWEKFKSWMTSFWNWITRKKVKSNSSKAKKIADSNPDNPESKKLKDAVDTHDKNVKDIKNKSDTATKKMDEKVNSSNPPSSTEVKKTQDDAKEIVRELKSTEEALDLVMRNVNLDKLTNDQRAALINKLHKMYQMYDTNNDEKLKKKADAMMSTVSSSFTSED